MAGSKTYQRTRDVLIKFSWVNETLRMPKALFLSYCARAHLIQLIRSVPLRYWPKLEGLSGIILENNSLWMMLDYNRGLPC